MTPEQLKASILQYAIQGKLVEQRPEEGTGEELYQQIQAEKQRLIKEGKIKKEKPLPEITEDEIPFDIPENWKWVRLGDLANINGGFAFKSTNYTSEGVRVIRISDFNERGFVNDKIVRYPYDDSLSQYVLDLKNILLCMTGGTGGKSLFITELDAVACGGVHLSSTSEIKEICYRGKEQIRGHVRTIWSVGEKAREYRRENERAVRECGKLLSSDSHTMTSTLEKFLSEDLELKKENRELKKKVIELELIERKEDTIVFESSVSITEAPEIVEKYAEGRKIFILDGTNKRNFLFFGTKDDFEKIKKECTLKGGGREPLFRGTIMDADIERIKKILS